ncbi:uncharacterized protein Dere_GG20772 [Drosophila erecta]|uniref:Peptidase S1 domain-containing protein n=1 Tax=Drosophila erecta TaxID=7220 RepID=B3NMW8_DROER|nr:uncharacterized protein Dere_GG20772 [Drosophila erecta]
MKVVSTVIAVLFCLFCGRNNVMSWLLDKKCGTSLDDQYDAKVIGGKKTSIRQNPWMVLVQSRAICGGSLITPQFVLTAAHCISVKGIPNSGIYVRLGEYETIDPNPHCVNNHCIPRFYNISVLLTAVHHDYKEFTYQNDIALLKMSKAVEYSDYVRPICLLVDEQLPSASKFTFTGWGGTEYARFSRILRNTTLHNVDISFCNRMFKKQADRSQICAASHTSNTCQGDSGGPLSYKFHYDNKLLTFQYGLASFGSEKCQINTPGVYTNVHHHMEWIINKMKDIDNNINKLRFHMKLGKCLRHIYNKTIIEK